MKIKLLLLALWAGLLISYPCLSQDFSNKGKEFWIAYPAHIDNTGSVMGVYLTSDVNTSGTLVAGSTTVAFNITANQVTKIFLGPNNSGDASNIPVYLSQHNTIATGAGIRINADRDIIVYAHIIRSARSGATLVLPTKVWGREYVIPSYRNTGSGGTNAGYGEFAVMASLPNTTIELTPSVTGRGGTPASGTPYQVTLKNPGDVYFYQGQQNEDISGIYIKSVRNGNEPCKPIAVFSASTWSAFDCPGASGGDNLFQQLFPTGAWGKTFITAPFINRPYDIIRVYTRTGGVTVNKTEGGVTTQLTNYNAAGRYYEYSTNQPTTIDASEPVQVAQFIVSQTCGGSQADPEMIMLNPIDQTLDNITVFSAHQNYVPPNQTQVTKHYLNILIPTSKANTLLIDNAAPAQSFVNIPGSAYSYLQADVTTSSASNPVHNIKADTGFIAIAYGFGNVESYGYNAGTNVIDRYQFVTIQNQFATVNFPATCKGSPFNISMTFPYQPTEIKWVFNGLFNDTTIANPVYDSTWISNGKQLYRYKLPRTYAINSIGKFKIQMIAQNPTADGCSGEQVIDYEIEVFDKPVSDFTFSTTGCLSDPVSFTDNSVSNGRQMNKYYWDFGDAANSITKAPTNQYTVAGTYTIKHTVITDIGCISDTSFKTISISQPPQAKFTAATPYCIGKQVAFSDASSPNGSTIIKWTWDFGDGSAILATTTPAVQYHTYNTAGTFTVKLMVETSSGCKSSVFSLPITVAANPVAAFTFGNGCLPAASVQFTDQSTGTGTPFTYNWDFGDGTTSALQNPVHVFNTATPVDVKLLVKASSGCSDSKVNTVNKIFEQPTAIFTAPNEVCDGAPVSFTDKSTATASSITGWQWDFDDGSNSTLQNPTKTYARPGVYTVKLVVTSAIGCLSVASTQQVTVNALPTADFNFVAPYCINQDITFNDASVANAGNITKWYWDMADGTNFTRNTATAFSHKYAAAGNYSVTLKTETDKGCVGAVLSKNIFVASLPVVNFGIPENCLNDPYSQFTDSSSIADGSVSQFKYSWTFGDANANVSNPNTSVLKNPQHKFTATGVYNVGLTVTSGAGCIASATKPFTINGAQPKADFTIDGGNEICSNTDAVITNNSSVDFGKIIRVEIYWDYANDPSKKMVDNQPANGKKYNYRYPLFSSPATQSYTIRMISYSGDNCLHSASQIITVKATPAPAFNALQGVCEDAPAFQFTASETSGMQGNGVYSGKGVNNSGLFNPATAGQGTQSIRYTFNAANGCSAFLDQTIQVYPAPTVNAGPDRYLLEGGVINLLGSGSGNGISYLWSPSGGLDNPVISQPKASPPENLVYQLTVTSSDGCKASDDVLVTVLKKPIIPNVFTPNGDGKNDVWEIPSLDSYPGNVVEVYNRYGQIIFRSVGYDIPWNGKFNGKDVPAGTYYYIVDPKNGRQKISGYVDVVR